MARHQLMINGSPAWELDHDLPPLWTWLFDPEAITESRRLHDTLFSAADRFQQQVARTLPLIYFQDVFAIFEEIRPDLLPRALDQLPDALVSLSLESVEGQRAYQHERASAHWEQFFHACQHKDQPGALLHWEHAALIPGIFHGGVQRDAIALAARCEEFHLTTHDRGQALVWLLMGQPVSRPAKALHHVWVERAAQLPAASFLPKKRWWNG